MPRPEARPPGPGDIRIPLTAQAQPRQRPWRQLRAQRNQAIVRRWAAHPVSVWYARAIGDMYGRGIAGYRGTVSTGASRNGSGRAADPATGFTGYATPPQLFTGWNPAAYPHSGTPLRGSSGLPDSSGPASGSPLDSAMASIMAGTGG